MESEKEQLLETFNNTNQQFLDNDPIGLPDDKDLKNIKTILRNFEKAAPGVIAAHVKEAKRISEEAVNDFGSSRDKSKRRVLTMPIALLREIEESYPLMFKNRKHLAWFIKHFKGFNTSKRY